MPAVTTALRFLTIAAAGYALLVLLAWIFQRHLVFLPMGTPPAANTVLPGAEEVTLETEDGYLLGAWFLRSEGEARGTAIVFNGNAGNRSHRSALATALARQGFSTLLFDYRGYGGNPGSPSERGLLLDARAAHRYVAARNGRRPGTLLYLGESLGSAVAVALATEEPPAMLILRSPFTSLTHIGRIHYPFLPVGHLLKYRFEVAESIQDVRCPLLVIAGEDDQIVPPEDSRALFDAAPSPSKRFVLLRGADHNDYALLAGERMLRAITDFVESFQGAKP